MQGRFASAPEVEPHTGVGEKQTRNRLDSLYDDGLLRRRKIGSANVYWLSDTGENRLSSAIGSV